MPNASGAKLLLLIATLAIVGASYISIKNTGSANTGFTRDLGLGSNNEEVLLLQQVLNKNPTTRITESGPGSPGKETTFFGALTAKAVARFQELHREKILSPNNLSKGSGFVGPSTRKVLNSLTLTETVTPDFKPLGYTYIIAPDNYAVIPGSKLTLTGVGFTKENNTIFFDKSRSKKITDLKSTNGATINLTVPDFPAGKYELYIENANGSSTLPSFVVITSPKSEAPVIESVSPTSGPYGSKVVIKGKNFTPTNNEVRTNYIIIPNLPSLDGTTITVSMDLFPEVPQLQGSSVPKQNFTLPVYMFVINSNGVSDKNNPGRFTLEL